MNKTYRTIAGDMWDTIAYKMLGHGNYTDKLIKCNIKYRNTFIFPAGVVLFLPQIQKDIPAGLPPWKRVVKDSE